MIKGFRGVVEILHQPFMYLLVVLLISLLIFWEDSPPSVMSLFPIGLGWALVLGILDKMSEKKRGKK